MDNLNVFEINLHYLIVAETENQAILLIRQLSDEKIDKVRECNKEKEGFVVFNKDCYRMETYQSIIERILIEQKNIAFPFLLRSKPKEF